MAFFRRPRSFLALAFLLLAAPFTVPSGCAGQPACQRNSDCLGAYCDNGDCKVDCVDASVDCPPHFHCSLTAQCEADDGSGGGGSATTDTSSTTSTVSDTTSASVTSSASTAMTTATTSVTSTTATTTSSTTASVTSTSSGTGTFHELDACATDGDCATPLLCRSMIPSGPRYCTRACATSTDCFEGSSCTPVGTESYCTAEDTGRACTAASDCNFACLTAQQYCTATCSSGADCPNGYGCAGVGTPAISVCIKAEAACDPTDTSACIAAAACDTSPNLVVDGCTLSCNTAADCPQRAAGLAPWTCDGLCRRPPDVSGPLEGGATPAQYACNGSGTVVNVCNDDQHIDFGTFMIPSPPAVSCSATTTTSGLGGDACLDSCRYKGGCHFGFACVAIGGIGTERIGLCLPTGVSDVGGTCTTDAQCRFGYCNQGTCSRDCTADGICPGNTVCTAAGAPDVEGLPFRRCE